MKAGAHKRTETQIASGPGQKVDSQSALVTTKVAHSIEEMMQAFAVRAAVFLSELACPYTEEFDGNDFTATHVLGYVGEEPASTCRLRYFADFAQLERVAVRQEFRNTRIGIQMIEFALDFCRQKGYRKLHGRCEEHMLPLWEAFGFKPIDGGRFVLLGREYFEVECLLEPHPDPLRIGKDPVQFIRPEGTWDETCALERRRAGPEQEVMESDWSAELKKRMDRLG